MPHWAITARFLPSADRPAEGRLARRSLLMVAAAADDAAGVVSARYHGLRQLGDQALSEVCTLPEKVSGHENSTACQTCATRLAGLRMDRIQPASEQEEVAAVDSLTVTALAR